MSATHTPSTETIVRPWERFLNEWVLGWFVYNVIQSTKTAVTASVYPYWLARDNKSWIKRGDTVDIDSKIFSLFTKISRKKAKPYESGEIV